jgi:glycosyltransferase involved in cell wall biosynthesis
VKPLISVIIPTHDRARRLEEALESVYAQQGIGVEFNMEVIVVDDASSDNTAEIVTNHPGVRYIRLPTNRGLAAARNAGVRVSSGEYVAFLDDDDIWFPHKLRQQSAELEKHPEVAAVYSPCLVRSQRREKAIPEKSRGPSGFVLNAFVKENFAPVHGYLLRRSAIARAGYFDEQLSCFEDWDLWVRIALHSLFIFLPGYVGVYRYSPHGMLGTAKAIGNHAVAHKRMMEKLRVILKDSTAPQKVVREARAWVELEFAGHLMTEQIKLAQSMRAFVLCSSHLLAALRIFQFPDVMREAEARQKIASIVLGMFKSYLKIVLPRAS